MDDRDIYFFDLQGFLRLPAALTRGEVDELNDYIDTFLPICAGEWYGYIQAHTYGDDDGLNLQQIYEAGLPFERLIDHPSWIERVKHFVGGEGSFDWHHGPLFIDENFANIRGPGESIGMHNGGHHGTSRCQFRIDGDRFHCNQINILVALTDIGPGDGATMLIPGSHKSNFPHPDLAHHAMRQGCSSGDQMEAAVEVHMDAGDAVLFVDSCTHGSARRVNAGERRVVVYRYGPSWGNFRHPYQPSPELLERLSPERRQIVWPQKTMGRTPNKAPAFRGIEYRVDG